MSSIAGRVCIVCKCDEAVIGFDYVPDRIGIDPVTREWLHVIPDELRGQTYCTGCGSIYTKGHVHSRELTLKIREVMDGEWPREPRGFFADDADDVEFGGR